MRKLTVQGQLVRAGILWLLWCLLLGGCPINPDDRIPSALVGKWYPKQSPDTLAFEITSAGKIISGGMSYDLSVSGKTLRLKYEGGYFPEPIGYSISNGELNLTTYGTDSVYVKTRAYTVIFDSNGGSGTIPGPITVQAGYSITLPSGNGMSKNSAAFGGWDTEPDGTGTNYAAGSSFTPSGNITLYARWDVIPFDSVTTLADKLAWLETYAQNNASYILEVNADENIKPHTLFYYDYNYPYYKSVTITLRGGGASAGDSNRTISLSSNGTMFWVGSGVTLILDNNITLQGRSGNTNSLVWVNSGGTFIMNEGSAITGNTYTPSYGGSSGCGGVYVSGDYNGVSGTFTMNGGAISGNSGGGVYLNFGTFTMNGGEISGNTGSGVSVNGTFTMAGGEISGNTGRGVYVDGTFTMEGGTISGNTGSGVSVGYGTFTMEGGTISGNTGSGVYVVGYYNATFTMNGGEISGNTSSYFGSSSGGNGGGVYVNGTFTMAGGEISGNTASYFGSSSGGNGGGVYVNGTFTMAGGEISGNTASYFGSGSGGNGGGVYVGSSAIFRIVTGTVYGSDAAEGLRNNASNNNNGAALYNYGGTAQRGTFSGETWTSKGDLSITNNTIRVVDGEVE